DLSIPSYLFFLLTPPPPKSTLFPYTTLFRSTTTSLPLPTASTAPPSPMPAFFRPSTRRTPPSRPPSRPPTPPSRRARRLLVTSRSEEHTSELQSLAYLACRLLLEKKNKATKH